MSDRPDIDQAVSILQTGGFSITGGKYAPRKVSDKNKPIVEQLKRLYPDCNGNISVSDDGGIASNGTIDDLIKELEK